LTLEGAGSAEAARSGGGEVKAEAEGKESSGGRAVASLTTVAVVHSSAVSSSSNTQRCRCQDLSKWARTSSPDALVTPVSAKVRQAAGMVGLRVARKT